MWLLVLVVCSNLFNCQITENVGSFSTLEECEKEMLLISLEPGEGVMCYKSAVVET